MIDKSVEVDQHGLNVELGEILQLFWKEALINQERATTGRYQTTEPKPDLKAKTLVRSVNHAQLPARGYRVIELGRKFLFRWYSGYVRRSLQEARNTEKGLKNCIADHGRQLMLAENARELSAWVHGLEVERSSR